MTTTATTDAASDFDTVSAIANAAAFAIGRVRPIVIHENGTQAVELMERPELPTGYMDAWFDPAEDGSGEGCFHLQMLGVEAEVYFVR